MRSIAVTLWLLAHAAEAAVESTRLPTDIVERIAACVGIEDSEPARAVIVADSLLDAGLGLDPAQRAAATACRGWAHAVLGHRDHARRDAHTLADLVEAMPASAEQVRLQRRAGAILHRIGERIAAVDFYARALAGAEAAELDAERIPILVNLGVLHSEGEENDRARAYYEQALALMHRTGDVRHEAPVRFNLALTLAGQEQHALAIPHLRRVLELLQQPSAPGGLRQLVGTRIELATALQRVGEDAEARHLLDEVLATDVATLDESLRMQVRLVEAERLAENGQAQAALVVLDGIAPAGLSDAQRLTLANRRAALLESMGRYRELAEVLRNANAMRETYLRAQNHERLAALEAHMRDREQRLELQRLQTEAAERERQLRNNRHTLWIVAGAALLLLTAAATVLLGQRRMNRRLYRASRTDPLTGLDNRRAMAERLRELGSGGSHTALLLVDIDHFKRINDEHGHDVGDEVLVAFAERLRGRAGAEALVARWGGEEFLVALPRSDETAACATAAKLRAAVARPVDTMHGAVSAQASIGIANLPMPGGEGADAWHMGLQLADHALYLAKRSGRDAWVCFWITAEIPDWPPERIASEAMLARSLGVIAPSASRPLHDVFTAVAG